MERTYQLSFVSDSNDCGVILYDRESGAVLRRVPFMAADRIGKLQRMRIEINGAAQNCLYQFYDETGVFPDPKGRLFFAAKKYGEPKGPEDIYTVLNCCLDFDWQGSQNPRIPYEDGLVYCLHLRGFTKHASSGVKARGTFEGLIEKIPYLKGLGVTTLEFQPIYEFNERPKALRGHMTMLEEKPRLNYWGYTEGLYFAPKADYARENAVTECKRMIRALHQNNMEAVMQFYFPGDFNPMNIPEILCHWVEEYHVDGFHLIGENLPSELLARIPELSETKLWYYRMDEGQVYGRNGKPKDKVLALLRDDFLYDMRRFLKGDEGMIQAVMYHLRSIPRAMGRIHYLSTYWGFTLMDMVSYDFKHNEANGEDNHDGTDYNCSWNCGEEGYSRKKRIQKLRLQQLKNAFCLLLFSQSTPRIFMGDEFGNTQKGNNNPYCQDNEIAWLNWKFAEKNGELLRFFKKLGAFRREHCFLHPASEADMMDSLSCGYPDLSYHGMTAWRPQTENYSRQLGVMYCGMYGKKRTDEFLYLAMNMHWESHSLAFPRLPKGKGWTPLFATCGDSGEMVYLQDMVQVPPKTMAVFVSRDIAPEELKENEDERISEAL